MDNFVSEGNPREIMLDYLNYMEKQLDDYLSIEYKEFKKEDKELANNLTVLVLECKRMLTEKPKINPMGYRN